MAKLINAGSLEAVLDSGRLPDGPGWPTSNAGKPAVGWKPVHGNQVSVFSPKFEFLGWGYAWHRPGDGLRLAPGLAAAPSPCGTDRLVVLARA